jgi:hypothetical protein
MVKLTLQTFAREPMVSCVLPQLELEPLLLREILVVLSYPAWKIRNLKILSMEIFPDVSSFRGWMA